MKSTTKMEEPIGSFLPLSKDNLFIISGGQSGADRAGLATAYNLGIHTGGFAPAGYRTIDNIDPSILRDTYGLVELSSINYAERTRWNVHTSDCTIRFAKKWNSPGEKCTLKWLKYYDKPYLDIDYNSDPRDTIPKIEQWILEQWKYISIPNIVINIAGNSETTCPGIYAWTCVILLETFEKLF